MKKKDEIIQAWIKFSQVDSRNIQQFINWASYHFETPKSYVRNILAEYNLACEQEKREKEQKEIRKYEELIKEILEEL
ncbi:MAG: hypothetical protein ACI3T9_07735 [Romboutsia timonensis]